MNRFKLLFMLLVLCLGALFVFTSPAAAQLQADSSDVNVRQPDPGQIEAYRNDPAFIYDETVPETSFISMLIGEILRFFDELFGEGTGNTVMRVFFVIALIGVMYLILSQIMSGNISSALTGRSASENIRYSRDPATQKDEDLNRMIDEAVEAGNYREAVRLLYQKTLKELSSAGLIDWAANKTNYDYLCEIDSHPSAGSFRKLTRIYEYTEYGEFGIDGEGFKSVRELYSRVNKQLSRGRNGKT